MFERRPGPDDFVERSQHLGHPGPELDVPFLLRPFKKKAIDVIEQEIKKWVKKAENGEV